MKSNFLTLFFLSLSLFLISCTEVNKKQTTKKDWAIAIHGGAGVISKDLPQDIIDGYTTSLKNSLNLGKSLLAEGKSALYVVEEVIKTLENDPRFNAGVGAVFTAEGKHELDASIMDGRDLSAGSVAGVKTVKSPITLARLVKDSTRHILLAGAGAEKFAQSMQVEMVDNSYFSTERRKSQLERAKSRQSSDLTNPLFFDDQKFGTVGCVVLDKMGNLAAGTSTGGMTNKKHGRIGDSPIIGAGTYADNRTVAVSSTGIGEEFIRHYVAARISANIQLAGMSLKDAADDVIFNILQPGDGGVICVDKYGNISMPFNSGGMFRAAADSKEFFEVKIWE